MRRLGLPVDLSAISSPRSEPSYEGPEVANSKPEAVLSAFLMLRRLAAALRVALREQDFERVVSAGLVLIIVGTITFTLSGGWSVVDGSTSQWRR
jgi:hypothetical protein